MWMSRVTPKLIRKGFCGNTRASLAHSAGIFVAEILSDADLFSATGNEPNCCTPAVATRNALIGITGAIVEPEGRVFICFPLNNRLGFEKRNLVAALAHGT